MSPAPSSPAPGKTSVSTTQPGKRAPQEQDCSADHHSLFLAFIPSSFVATGPPLLSTEVQKVLAKYLKKLMSHGCNAWVTSAVTQHPTCSLPAADTCAKSAAALCSHLWQVQELTCSVGVLSRGTFPFSLSVIWPPCRALPEATWSCKVSTPTMQLSFLPYLLQERRISSLHSLGMGSTLLDALSPQIMIRKLIVNTDSV